MITIAAVSDLHGNLPTIEPPEGVDTLVVAGDVSPIYFDREVGQVLLWLDTNFRKWLEDEHELGFKHIIGIAGNHDFVFERRWMAVDELHLPWTYLLDSATELNGVKYYGIPWVPNLSGFAFYGDRQRLEERYGWIPDDTDVIISHGPPMGHGDGGHPEWCASAANDAIKRVRPKAFICGHIHEGYGIYNHPKAQTPIYNVSFVDENYRAQDRITAVRIP